MRRLVLLALVLSACFDFAGAEDAYCSANPDQCGATGGGGSTGGGATAGGSAGGGGGGMGGGTGGGARPGVMNLEKPTAAGLPQVGQVLVGDAGVWANADELTFRWHVTLPDGGSRFEAFTDLTFVPEQRDVGGLVELEVLATQVDGGGAQVRSPAVGPVRLRPRPGYVTGFEHGPPFRTEAAALASSSVTSNVSADPAVARHGRYSMKVDAPEGQDGVWYLDIPNAPVAVLRFALRVTGGAGGTDPQEGDVAAFEQFMPRAALQVVDGGLQLRAGADIAGPVAVTPGAWHVIDLRANLGSNPWVVDWRVDGVDQPRLVAPRAGGDVTRIELGRPASGAAKRLVAHYDDVAWSAAPEDFPMGDGRVVAIPLERGGNHVMPELFDCRSASGFGPCDAGSFAAELNAWPDAGTYVQQTRSGAGAYLEHFLADSGVAPEPAPNAVHYQLTAYGSAGEPVPGFAAPFVMPSVPGGSATGWLSLHEVSGPAGPSWRPGELNATPVRLGFVAPNGSTVQVQNVVIQADFSQ